MTTILKDYFPMIQTKEKILKQIKSNEKLSTIFYSWKPSQQEDFLACCSGIKGFKILYDAFFKEVFNPEYNPYPLEEFLSQILNQRIRILYLLPNDTVRIADETSLLLTDIVVELADGSIANIEMQKIGYKFLGERASCYSADLLLRQYKRIRNEKKEAFSYKDVKTVYTIILFEVSPFIFHTYPDTFLHYFQQKSNTGIEINFLQKYIFIPLDLFSKKLHNNGITNELEAWLTFLTIDEPELIIKLLEAYPRFQSLYNIIYQMCLNMEGVMNMFSEELRIMDRNTVQLMIDEMQEELDAKDSTIHALQKENEELRALVAAQKQ